MLIYFEIVGNFDFMNVIYIWLVIFSKIELLGNYFNEVFVLFVFREENINVGELVSIKFILGV